MEEIKLTQNDVENTNNKKTFVRCYFSTYVDIEVEESDFDEYVDEDDLANDVKEGVCERIPQFKEELMKNIYDIDETEIYRINS